LHLVFRNSLCAQIPQGWPALPLRLKGMFVIPVSRLGLRHGTLRSLEAPPCPAGNHLERRLDLRPWSPCPGRGPSARNEPSGLHPVRAVQNLTSISLTAICCRRSQGEKPSAKSTPTNPHSAQPQIVAKFTANAPPAFVDQYIDHRNRYSAIAMEVGDQVGLRVDATELHNILDDYGIANGFEICPGTHTSAVARYPSDSMQHREMTSRNVVCMMPSNRSRSWSN
jgi:hypothetical protein